MNEQERERLALADAETETMETLEAGEEVLRKATSMLRDVAPDMVRDSGVFCGAIGAAGDLNSEEQAALNAMLPADNEASPNAGLLREEHVRLVRNEYADTVWHIEDVRSVFNVSEAEARKFLREIETLLRDAMVARGWELIRDEGMARGSSNKRRMTNDDYHGAFAVL